MPRNHKPRRRYVPKRVDLDTVGLAMSGAAQLTPHQRSHLLTPVQTAFEQFREGQGHLVAWQTLGDAMNIAEALAQCGIANDHIDKFKAGQHALAEVFDRRFKGGGSFTLRAQEICALDDALFIHRIQLDHCSQTELMGSIELVKRRVAGALAGSAPAGTRLCNPGHLGRQIAQEMEAAA